MDYKVADLRKKLNKLKYETSTKTDRIARLMKDYEKVVNMNAEIVSLIFFWKKILKTPQPDQFLTLRRNTRMEKCILHYW